MSLLASVVLIIIISFQDLEITKEIREKLKSLSQVEYNYILKLLMKNQHNSRALAFLCVVRKTYVPHPTSTATAS